MPEQFEFDFTAETPEEELQRLRAEYQKCIGVTPDTLFEKDALLVGINDPEKERNRLRAIARAEDDEEMLRTYRRSR